MLSEIKLINPKVFKDDRGFFKETWNQRNFEELLQANITFRQDNISRSKKGVLRGLHFQNPNGQGKLVTVLSGSVIDVVVDVAVGSPTFGCYTFFHLTEDNHSQLYIPPTFAHGFLALEDCIFSYKCTEFYDPKSEHTLIYNDPDVGITWESFGMSEFNISEKDLKGKRLKDFLEEELPTWEEKLF